MLDLVPVWNETYESAPYFLREQNTGIEYEGMQRLQAVVVFDLSKELFCFVRNEDFKTRPRFCNISRCMPADDRKRFLSLHHKDFGHIRAAYFCRVEGGKCHQVTTPVCCTRVAPVWHCHRC